MASFAANFDKQPKPSPADTLLISASVVFSSNAKCQYLSSGANVLIKHCIEPEPNSLNSH